jgi:hypothetical protein
VLIQTTTKSTIYLDGIILKALPEYTKLTTKMYCVVYIAYK